MKLLSYVTLTVLLSMTACSHRHHHEKDCCKDKQAKCQDEKCEKKEKTCCKDDHCEKKKS